MVCDRMAGKTGLLFFCKRENLYISENYCDMSNRFNFRMLLAAAVIIAFFLPWFDLGDTAASAFDMSTQKISGEASDKTTRMIVQYSFLLIPFFGLVILIRTAAKRSSGFFLRLLPFLVTAILTVLFIVGIVDEGGGKEELNSLLQVMSYGYYISVAASLLLIFV